MKKRIFTIILCVLGIFCLNGCSNKEKDNLDNSDAIKFKEEYEMLNGKTNANEMEYRSLQIEEDNPFIYTTAEDIVEKIESKETFYVYFGSSYCPWCRSVIEKFIDVAKDNNINKVYYINIWEKDHVEILRDTYTLNEKGKVVLVSEGTDAYQKLLEYFDNVLNDYTLVNEKGKSVSVGEKRIFAPNFIYVENGKSVKLENGISELQNDSRMELNEDILKDIENKFTEFFSK